MTTSTLTENLNLMQPNNFQVVMNRESFGTTTYMAQSFQHPEVTLGYSLQPYGNKDIVQPGAKLDIGSLSITFLIDEEMKLYDELFNYLIFLRDVNMDQTLINPSQQLAYEHFMQISINILSNKNNLLRTIKYLDCVLSDIGPIEFSSLQGEDFLTLTAEFKFSEFEVV